MKNTIKVLFEISSADKQETDIESVWAIPEGNGFRLDNIPFYVKGFAFGDLVHAKQINGSYVVDGLLSPSGHSTIRIWFLNTKDIQSTRAFLEATGCGSEVSDQPQLVAVDVPPNVSYAEIQAFLEDGLSKGKWDYEEACLGFLSGPDTS